MSLKTHYMTSNNDLPSIVNVLDEWGDSQDPRVEITVERLCLTCDFAAMRIGPPYPWVFNTRSRIMHLAGEATATMCGKEATGQTWLWQL